MTHRFPCRTALAALFAAAFALLAPLAGAQVPYVPTPQGVVDRMLEMAKVTGTDVVYDLGCGDGRIVVTAAKRYGARGVGIDINPERISEANDLARSEKVTDKVKFMQGDLFQADFSEASVVTLYLLPDINLALRPQLWRQLKVGSRVVSHDYHMGDDWLPEQTERVAGKIVYAWTIKPEHKKMGAN
jgi:ubiquinone/menaquinone biosynthesis C-methylase UbiE